MPPHLIAGQYAFLPRQPAGRYTKTAKAICNASVGDQVRFGIDPTGPTGGSLLANLIQTPSLWRELNRVEKLVMQLLLWV